MENNINVNTGNQININMGGSQGELKKPVKELTIFDSAMACVLFLVLSFLFSLFISIAGINTSDLAENHFFFYIVLHVCTEGIFALAALFIVGRKSLVQTTGMDKKVNGNIVGICFLISIISLIGFSDLTNVFVEFLQYFGYSSVLPSMKIDTFGKYIGYLVSSCLVAGFCEELLFRGVVESGFKKWGMKVAVGFSALIFMLMHGNPEQTVHQFIIGVIIGYIYYKTNNLWLGVLVHVFNNFIPVTLSFLLEILPTTETASDVVVTTTEIGLGTILINLIIAILVASAGIYFLKILLNKLFKENEMVNGETKEIQTEDNLVSIKVDGSEETIEVKVDGENLNKDGKVDKPTISGLTIVLFFAAGMYFAYEWIFYLLKGLGKL